MSEVLHEAGVFTEFMEQRPGPYGCRRQDLPRGLDSSERRSQTSWRRSYLNDPKAHDRKEQLMARISLLKGYAYSPPPRRACQIHGGAGADPERAAELRRIGDVCSRGA